MGPVPFKSVLWRTPADSVQLTYGIVVGKGRRCADGTGKYVLLPCPLFPAITGIFVCVDDSTNTAQDFRYTCEQNEGMAGYGWDEYDIRTGGRETIHDARNSLDLTIDFIKVPGGEHGGSWGARIKGQPRSDAAPDQPTTLIFYTAMEGAGEMEVSGETDPLGSKEDVKLGGSTPELGDFTLDVTRGPSTNKHPPRMHPSYDEKPLDRTFVTSTHIQDDGLWQGKGKTLLWLSFGQG